MTLPEAGLQVVFMRAITSARAAVPDAPVDAVLTGLAAAPAGGGMPLSLLIAAISGTGDQDGDVVAIRDALVALGELVARVDPGTADEWVGPAHDLISEFFVSRLSAEQFRLVHWRIAQAAKSVRADAPSSRTLAYVMQHISDHLWLAGRPGEALAEVPRLETPADNLALWQMWKDRLANLGADNLDVLGVRGNVATWTGQSGDGRGALEQFTALLPDIIRVRGNTHPDTFRIRGNLAVWTGRTGDLAGALQGFNALLHDQERVLGRDHPDVLVTRGNIVTWTGESGDARAALELANQLLRDEQGALDPHDPRILNTRAQIVQWTGRSGDTQRALELARELLPDQERVLGVDHTDTLATRSMIVILTATSGNLSQALKDSSTLLRDQQRVLGPDHPDVLTTRSNVATWTGQLGEVQEALSATAELLRDRLRVLGPDHRDTLGSRNNYAIWVARSGDVQRAIEAFFGLLSDQERVLGPNHPDTLDTRGNIALWIGWSGDVPAALERLNELLRDQERVLGSEHPGTEATRNYIRDFTAAGKSQHPQGGMRTEALPGKITATSPTARRAPLEREVEQAPLSEVRFLSVAEVASIMRISKMSVYRLVHSGELEAIRVRRSFRVPEQAVRQYLRKLPNPGFSSEPEAERRT